MKISRTWAALAAAAALVAGFAPAAVAATASPAKARPDGLTTCSAAFFAGDQRLGPDQLPFLGPVGFELLGYQRTGSLSAHTFLADFYNPAANGGTGGWIYPPDNGYVIASNGTPIEAPVTLRPGQQVDRYGSEYGSFLAPAGLPYAQRSIPPQSLDNTPGAPCNYHDYRVLKPFQVDAGPIAPWFAQPGYGLQYQLDATLIPGGPPTINVMWLVDNGYLQRVV